MTSQIFALMYAIGFAVLDQANWWLGAAFGAFHGFVAFTLIVPTLPGFHPRMASERSGPDPNHLGSSLTTTDDRPPIVTLIAHAIYGMLLGIFLTPGS